jgi:TetR/AcrR family transcriptional regulator, mexJK operon transcriptional repressor
MENDTCHFSRMEETTQPPEHSINKVGRPRRGTESARTAALIGAATRVFLRDGYGRASIDKVASEAGVSTRTIYERFKNKADLLAAVITRLVDRDMESVLATAELDRLDPKEALTVIAGTITSRVRDPESAALFRIVATEAVRFPELAAKMRDSSKSRWDGAIADYFRGQIKRGTLNLADPDRSAVLFLQMICAELHEHLLFGCADSMAQLDLTPHLTHVIDIFLFGAAPRADRSTHDGAKP